MKILTSDIGRITRCGIPEVIYGRGKSLEDNVSIARQFLKESGRAIITKIDEKDARKVASAVSGKDVIRSINSKAKTLILKKKKSSAKKYGTLGVLTAGTSDIPVAEEAKEIAQEIGLNVLTEYDCGVAGIHRLYTALEKMKDAQVLIVVAGMEGALPSVVAGLVDVPVIGVPTSVGYGTGEGGKAALYTMLNSCTPLAVLNIDNGFGAAVFASQILRKRKWQP